MLPTVKNFLFVHGSASVFDAGVCPELPKANLAVVRIASRVLEISSHSDSVLSLLRLILLERLSLLRLPASLRALLLGVLQSVGMIPTVEGPRQSSAPYSWGRSALL